MTESARDYGLRQAVKTAIGDAALAQPPDAKAVALVSITDAGWVQFFVHGIYIQSGYGEEEFKRLTALAEKVVEAAAPQPPAGKGEPVAFMADVAKDFLNDCTQSKKLAEEWQQSGLCVIPLYEAPPDAIPREIHERLVRDARREALREAYEDLWNTEPADRMERLKQLASEHEGGK
jgi:hypothetical protein